MLNGRIYRCVAVGLCVLLLVSGCSRSQSQLAPLSPDTAGASHEESGDAGEAEHTEEMPDLSAVTLANGQKLRVVATTGIVADVVANIGGDSIELAPLMPVGADPHSFTATPADLRTLNDAHVIFINGLGLEESLMPILENLDEPVPLVSVNAGVELLQLDGDGHEDEASDTELDGVHSGADPHTWFSVPNVSKWADNVAHSLSTLDPANAEAYRNRAARYQAELDELDRDVRQQISELPEVRRKIVTDHIALGYFAVEYGFETVGSVLPGLSTLAAASAQELAALQARIAEQGVPALFVSTTVNPQTTSQLANDLGIPIVELYIGSLSDSDGPAPTYIDLMRFDVEQIVEALR